MSESSRPRSAAVVAAPILKLWPAYLLSSSPRVWSAARTLLTTWDFSTGLPLGWQNKGPSAPPLSARYARRAATGHRSLPDLPRYTLIPLLNGSVSDCLRWISIVDGSDLLSIAISLNSRGLLRCGEEATSSLRWKKPQKHVLHTAHTVMVSLCSADEDRKTLIWRRMSGLIGRRGAAFPADLRKPLSTRDNFGIGIDLGSGRL